MGGLSHPHRPRSRRARGAHVLAQEVAIVAKVLVKEFLTLDGVMQAPGTPDEDRSGGFDQGGWQLPYFDDAFGEFVDASFNRAGALLLGRNTYDIFAAYWPNATDDPIGDTMNGFRKY